MTDLSVIFHYNSLINQCEAIVCMIYQSFYRNFE